MDFDNLVDRIREEYGLILNDSFGFLNLPKKQELLKTYLKTPNREFSTGFKLKRNSLGTQLSAFFGLTANWGKKALGIVPLIFLRLT